MIFWASLPPTSGEEGEGKARSSQPEAKTSLMRLLTGPTPSSCQTHRTKTTTYRKKTLECANMAVVDAFHHECVERRCVVIVSTDVSKTVHMCRTYRQRARHANKTRCHKFVEQCGRHRRDPRAFAMQQNIAKVVEEIFRIVPHLRSSSADSVKRKRSFRKTNLDGLAAQQVIKSGELEKQASNARGNWQTRASQTLQSCSRPCSPTLMS